MLTKVEGRGNGIKTRIVNMFDIAKALHRKPDYCTKFFGCELGAQSKCNEKTQLSVVNGEFDTPTMDALLDEFVKKWVLCPGCALPETDLSVKKGLIFVDCNACGFHGQCDMSSRLAVYIVKNPPKPTKTVTRKSKKEDAEEEIYNKAKGLEIAEDGDDGWTVDVSENAVEQRREKAAIGEPKVQEYEDPELSEDAPPHMVELHDIIFSNATPAEKKKAIRKIQQRENIGNEQRTCLIFELCFNKAIIKQIMKHLPLLEATCKHPRCQMVLLDCIELFVAETEPTMLKHVCDILNVLYDKEIIEEPEIMAWYKRPNRQLQDQEKSDKVRRAMKPFIEWLQQADEDDDEEEEEEDDE
jgi:translation initiation factor 5